MRTGGRLVAKASLLVALVMVPHQAMAIPPDGYNPGGHCPGAPTMNHHEHAFPINMCRFLSNPHYAHIGSQPCTTSGVHTNCEGCQACCVGKYVQHVTCICSTPTCTAFAEQAHMTCNAACIADYEGNGCKTDPNEAQP